MERIIPKLIILLMIEIGASVKSRDTNPVRQDVTPVRQDVTPVRQLHSTELAHHGASNEEPLLQPKRKTSVAANTGGNAAEETFDAYKNLQGYIKGEKKEPINGNMFWKILKALEGEKLKFSRIFEEMVAQILLQHGKWFVSASDSIEKHPVEMLNGKFLDRYAKIMIIELLSTNGKGTWIYDNKLVVANHHFLKYWHLGKLCVHPISLEDGKGDDDSDTADGDQGDSAIFNPRRNDFEHVILLRDVFKDEEYTPDSVKHTLLYLIGLLTDGKHIIPADCSKWFNYNFEAAFNLANRNGNIVGITEIDISHRLHCNPSVAGALKSIDYMEICFLNCFYSFRSDYTKLIQLIKDAEPRGVSILAGDRYFNCISDILNVPESTIIRNLSIDKMPNFFFNTANSDSLCKCSQLRGLSPMIPHVSSVQQTNFAAIPMLMKRLQFLHINGKDCHPEIVDSIVDSEIDALVVDFRHASVKLDDYAIMEKLLSKKSFSSIIFLANSSKQHKIYLRKCLKPIKDQMGDKRVILVRELPYYNNSIIRKIFGFATGLQFKYEELYPTECKLVSIRSPFYWEQ